MDKHIKGSPSGVPLILWNHRWEYDKAPSTFFEALFKLKAENIPFKVVVLGKDYEKAPAIFAQIKQHLAIDWLILSISLNQKKPIIFILVQKTCTLY